MADQVLGKGRFLQLVNRNQWEFCERIVGHGVVIIVAVTTEGRLLLVEQFRPALNKNVIELPAGLSGDVSGSENEHHATAAQRELLEETGYEAGSMEFLIEGPVSSGITTEVVSFFHARELKRVHQGGGDASENIKVHEVPLPAVEAFARQKIAEGCLIDPKIFSALYFAAARGHRT